MSKKTKPEIKTEWTLFECEKGRRWSEVSKASYHPANPGLSKTGDFCQFSGCLERDHRITAVRKVEERDFTHGWFRGWEPWESSPVSRSLRA